MKEKAPGARTYDNEGFKQRAGCLCFRDETEREVLLVSSSRHHDRWVVPAGCIEEGEEVRNAAVREVLEEAGVKGRVCRFLGLFQSDVAKSRTYVYSLIVTEELDRNRVPLAACDEKKERRWFPVEEALKILTHRPVQQAYLTTALQKRTRSSSNHLLGGTKAFLRQSASPNVASMPAGLRPSFLTR